jgi:hypothetical protein
MFGQNSQRMKNTTIALVLVSVLALFTGCKSDAPNPSPKVTHTFPSSTSNKYRVNKDIPVKFAVHDKDGLSSVTYSVLAVNEGVSLLLETPSVSGTDFTIDATFQLASILGKDKVDCHFIIEAIDNEGNKRTFRTPFLVKK